MIDVLDRIARQRVVPVLRSADAADAIATARACARAGMTVVELTFTTPGVEEAVRELSADDLVLGVGTVTDAGRIGAVVEAGARFVVSFTAPPAFVAAARELGVTAIPGALTPTEVAACRDAGARIVKLFPARQISPGYLRDLRAVMPGLEAIVTGGIRAERDAIEPWLDAGAVAVGLGSDLGTVATHGADEVERRARAALEHAAAS